MSDVARWTREELDAYMAKFHSGKLHSPAKPNAKTILPLARKMNATETAWSQELDRRGIKWRWEAITLRLANNCRYTPDFSAYRESWNGVCFWEVKRAWKGKKRPHIEDDARVKLLVAAKEYQEFNFWLVWYDGSVWHEEPVNG